MSARNRRVAARSRDNDRSCRKAMPRDHPWQLTGHLSRSRALPRRAMPPLPRVPRRKAAQRDRPRRRHLISAIPLRTRLLLPRPKHVGRASEKGRVDACRSGASAAQICRPHQGARDSYRAQYRNHPACRHRPTTRRRLARSRLRGTSADAAVAMPTAAPTPSVSGKAGAATPQNSSFLPRVGRHCCERVAVTILTSQAETVNSRPIATVMMGRTDKRCVNHLVVFPLQPRRSA